MKIVYKVTEVERLYKKLNMLLTTRDKSKQVDYIEVTKEEWQVFREDLGIYDYFNMNWNKVSPATLTSDATYQEFDIKIKGE